MATINGIPRSSPKLSPTTGSAEEMRVAVIGGTSGLGGAIARDLARHGARVTVVGRTFRDQGTPNLDFVAADLESVAEARRVAEKLPAEDLDMLVFTTGIISAPEREVTDEGIEKDLAISYMSRYVMIRALAGRLGKNRDQKPRVFVMGFPGTDEGGNPDDLNAEREYKQMAVHMNTVAANEALVLDSASRYPHISFFGLNPGLVKTNIRANVLGGTESMRFKLVETMIGWFTPTPEQYAGRIVPALLAPELEKETGFHLNKKAQPIEPSPKLTPDRVNAFISATERLLRQNAPAGTRAQ